MFSAPPSNAAVRSPRRDGRRGTGAYTFCPLPKTGAAMSASAPVSAPVFLSPGRGRLAHGVPFPVPAGTEGITHYTLRGKVVCQRRLRPLWNPPAFPRRHVTDKMSATLDSPGNAPSGGKVSYARIPAAAGLRHAPRVARATGAGRGGSPVGQSVSSSTYSMTSSTRHCSSLHRRSIVLVDTL